MRTTELLAVSAVLFLAVPTFGQNSGPAGGPMMLNPAKPVMAAPARAAKPAVAASTPQLRSAAALAAI